MKTRILSMTIILICGMLLFSCSTQNGSVPTNAVDVDAVRTEAVSTYASSLTETLVAVPVASATRTIVSPTPSLTATPEITTTPEVTLTANPCYNVIWVSDVTIPDGSQMKANEAFTKTWLVQNVGGCAIPAGFTFQNVGGDSMRGAIVVLKEPIPVGAKREISVELAVPSGVNGLIQSSWRMADSSGVFFGDTLTVNIIVGDITTPAVTNTP
ncbi:MAG: hypothetical protein KA473_03195 [Anaerolineales bacterium]|nr:hypothetical protein [Anaerolineales bacterium]MBP6208415.1 hypothetical protein [Anaerolineales bacterium]